MVAILRDKLERERKNVLFWRDKREQLQLQNSAVRAGRAREYSEGRLVQERIALLQQDIARLTAMVHEEAALL